MANSDYKNYSVDKVREWVQDALQTEATGEEIARYNLKPRDYKASCQRGYKIVRPDKPKRKKKEVIKPAPKPVDKKRKELLCPIMKFKTIQFDKKPKLLHPKRK